MALAPLLTQEMFEEIFTSQIENECNEFIRYFDSEIEKHRSNMFIIDIKLPDAFDEHIHLEYIKNIYLNIGWQDLFILRPSTDKNTWKLRFTVLDTNIKDYIINNYVILKK